jgi:hypothetical protein
VTIEDTNQHWQSYSLQQSINNKIGLDFVKAHSIKKVEHSEHNFR